MLVSQEDATILLSHDPYTLLPLRIVSKRGTFSFTYVHTYLDGPQTCQENNCKTPKKTFF